GLKAQKSSTGASATPHFEPISGNTPTATCRLSRSRRGSSAVTRACWVTCHLLGPSPRLRGSVLHNSASASSPSGGTQFMLPLVSSTNKKFAGIKLASTATAAHWLNRGAASVCHQFAPPSSGLELGSSPLEDRKSTRLNSSHVKISYAVFCLKKKILTFNEVVM